MFSWGTAVELLATFSLHVLRGCWRLAGVNGIESPWQQANLIRTCEPLSMQRTSYGTSVIK